MQRRNALFRGTTLLARARRATLARNVRQSPENRFHSRASGCLFPVRASTKCAALCTGDGTAFPFIVTAITAYTALATRGQCMHCLPLVGRCPTSNTGIIARLGTVVKSEFAAGTLSVILKRMPAPPKGEPFGLSCFKGSHLGRAPAGAGERVHTRLSPVPATSFSTQKRL